MDIGSHCTRKGRYHAHRPPARRGQAEAQLPHRRRRRGAGAAGLFRVALPGGPGRGGQTGGRASGAAGPRRPPCASPPAAAQPLAYASPATPTRPHLPPPPPVPQAHAPGDSSAPADMRNRTPAVVKPRERPDPVPHSLRIYIYGDAVPPALNRNLRGKVRPAHPSPARPVALCWTAALMCGGWGHAGVLLAWVHGPGGAVAGAGGGQHGLHAPRRPGGLLPGAHPAGVLPQDRDAQVRTCMCCARGRAKG